MQLTSHPTEGADEFHFPKYLSRIMTGFTVLWAAGLLVLLFIPVIDPGESGSLAMIAVVLLFGGFLAISVWCLRVLRGYYAVTDEGIWWCLPNACESIRWGEVRQYRTRFWLNRLDFSNKRGENRIPLYLSVDGFKGLYTLIRERASALDDVPLPRRFRRLRFLRAFFTLPPLLFLVLSAGSIYMSELWPAVGLLAFTALGLVQWLREPTLLEVVDNGVVLSYPFRDRLIEWDQISSVELPNIGTISFEDIYAATAVQILLSDGDAIKIEGFRDPFRLHEAVNRAASREHRVGIGLAESFAR